MSLRNFKHQPHPSIISCIEKKDFPLSSCPAFNHKPMYLATEEYKQIDDLIKRKITHLYNQESISYEQILKKYQQVATMIMRREKDIKEQLQNLAVEIITTIFSPPEHLDLKAMITSRTQMDIDPKSKKPNMMPNITSDRLEYLNQEIQKRVLLNALVQGSSMNIWKSCHYLVMEKLDLISPSLMPLYDEYISLTSLSVWKINVSLMMDEIQRGNEMGANADGGFMVQGQCKVDFKQNPGKVSVEVKAVNFPVMLHELTKGIVDYLICHAIPKDLSESELDYYYNKADAYQNELWHYIMSPTLWNIFVQTSNCDTQDLAKAIYAACKMPAQDLQNEFKKYIDEHRANN